MFDVREMFYPEGKPKGSYYCPLPVTRPTNSEDPQEIYCSTNMVLHTVEKLGNAQLLGNVLLRRQT